MIRLMARWQTRQNGINLARAHDAFGFGTIQPAHFVSSSFKCANLAGVGDRRRESACPRSTRSRHFKRDGSCSAVMFGSHGSTFCGAPVSYVTLPTYSSPRPARLCANSWMKTYSAALMPCSDGRLLIENSASTVLVLIRRESRARRRVPTPTGCEAARLS